MPMTIRSASTIGFIGLSATNTIGYQERKSIKRYYIIKGESLPVTIIP